MNTCNPRLWGRYLRVRISRMIQLRSNEYWGRRGGGKHKDGTNCFKIKRGGPSSSNSGPVGWKAKRARRGVVR